MHAKSVTRNPRARRGIVLGALLAAVGAPGCVPGSDMDHGTQSLGSKPSAPRSYEVLEPEIFRQEGVASYYGPGFHGKRTANGETFDTNNHLTAAHQTLPFGTRVRVTRVDNGRSVVVRINDRGPFAKGRIIDLSTRAAEALDMIQQGTATVRVESLTEVDPYDMKAGDCWTIQIAAFRDLAAAKQFKARLDVRHDDVYIEKNDRGFWRVRMGSYGSKADAIADLGRLEDYGVRPIAVPVIQ